MSRTFYFLMILIFAGCENDLITTTFVKTTLEDFWFLEHVWCIVHPYVRSSAHVSPPSPQWKSCVVTQSHKSGQKIAKFITFNIQRYNNTGVFHAPPLPLPLFELSLAEQNVHI